MPRRPLLHRVLLVAAAIVVVLAVAAVYNGLYRAGPEPVFDSDEEHFLYGSIGAEAREGIPYWVWLVLPRIFPDLIPRPGGYAALGLLSEPGREMPIGLTRVTIGYPRVAANCALCHTGSVRTSPGELPRIIPGAPAHQGGAQAYRRFLAAAARDARFNAGTILSEIARNYRLSFVERLLYRFVIIPGTRRQLLRLGDQLGDAEAAWAPGREDLFGLLQRRKLGQPATSPAGAADSVPLWNLEARADGGLFWDGLHTSLRDAFVSSALSEGSGRPWLDRDVERWDEGDTDRPSSLGRIRNYLATLKPPPYPFPVDAALAAAGEAVYSTECAQCHAPDGERAGTPIPVSEVGTDPQRLGVWTDAASAAYDAFAARRVWKAGGFRRTGGYMAVPLDGLWMRAPYLHNGSVPTLADLLEAPDNRPVTFWRGYDVYDPVKVGFVSDGPEARSAGTLYDTRREGNSNGGHVYGVTLDAEQKRALLEFLKTL